MNPHGTQKAIRQGFSRRHFVTAMGAVGMASPLLAQVEKAEAAAPEISLTGPKVKVAVVGCGGRGQFMAKLFQQHGGYEIYAVTDYFQAKAESAGKTFNVPQERCFSGLDGYKRALETKPEMVAIMSPPYFHPRQAAAAVDAGAHTYVAKPIAVDVPGCRSIEASAELAGRKKLCFLVDFQTRSTAFYQEAIKRVHAGAIGDLVFGEVYYHCERLGKKSATDDGDGRISNWVFDKALSGDIITEQNIHCLDVMNWVCQTPPLSAYGTGGRKVRVDVGDCWDHFALHYKYPNNVGMVFTSRQFDGHGTQPDGIVCRVMGSKGVLETAYGGTVMIRGQNFYRGGSTPQIYRDGAFNNVIAFYDAIKKGDHANPTVAPSVQSCIITIMGRKAAYTGDIVTWDQIINDTERLDGRLTGLIV
ncbi:MAG: Gfo/Idh/MocA family oxidoreductase [Kiritimatiellae bacterium]|nr:Gfo/Idh/MocA family oxidoreductase [Kiritimatiellia bacterium]